MIVTSKLLLIFSHCGASTAGGTTVTVLYRVATANPTYVLPKPTASHNNAPLKTLRAPAILRAASVWCGNSQSGYLQASSAGPRSARRSTGSTERGCDRSPSCKHQRNGSRTCLRCSAVILRQSLEIVPGCGPQSKSFSDGGIEVGLIEVFKLLIPDNEMSECL